MFFLCALWLTIEKNIIWRSHKWRSHISLNSSWPEGVCGICEFLFTRGVPHFPSGIMMPQVDILHLNSWHENSLSAVVTLHIQVFPCMLRTEGYTYNTCKGQWHCCRQGCPTIPCGSIYHSLNLNCTSPSWVVTRGWIVLYIISLPHWTLVICITCSSLLIGTLGSTRKYGDLASRPETPLQLVWEEYKALTQQ